jgi:hypothetical protein
MDLGSPVTFGYPNARYGDIDNLVFVVELVRSLCSMKRALYESR